jgi:chromosome segregation ATPase
MSDSMLTPERRAALRAVAEKATAGARSRGSYYDGGYWVTAWDGKGGSPCSGNGRNLASRVIQSADAEHIAAFDRETCLALLDVLEAAEADIASYKRCDDIRREANNELRVRIADLEARLAGGSAIGLPWREGVAKNNRIAALNTENNDLRARLAASEGALGEAQRMRDALSLEIEGAGGWRQCNGRNAAAFMRASDGQREARALAWETGERLAAAEAERDAAQAEVASVKSDLDSALARERSLRSDIENHKTYQRGLHDDLVTAHAKANDLQLAIADMYAENKRAHADALAARGEVDALRDAVLRMPDHCRPASCIRYSETVCADVEEHRANWCFACNLNDALARPAPKGTGE